MTAFLPQLSCTRQAEISETPIFGRNQVRRLPSSEDTAFARWDRRGTGSGGIAQRGSPNPKEARHETFQVRVVGSIARRGFPFIRGTRQERCRCGAGRGALAFLRRRERRPADRPVDKEKVIITWFSVQSYAVAAKGRVFLLDSYIYRFRTPKATSPRRCRSWWTSGRKQSSSDMVTVTTPITRLIAVKTGAHIYGAAEHCEAMAGDAARIFGAGTAVNCTSLTTPGRPRARKSRPST